MKKHGIYTISDQFFTDMNDPYLKQNKGEHRPHYYCYEDKTSGIYWMIPMSSKIEKYKELMQRRLDAKKRCDTLHIARLDNGKESVFLIQDIFPITENYIADEYHIGSNHLMVTSEHVAKELEHKAKKVIGMIKHGVKFTPTQPDVLAILDKLRE